MDSSELLFTKYDLGETLRQAPAKLAEAVDRLDDAELLDPDEDVLINKLVAAHVVKVPVLDLSAVETSQSEVELDLSLDPRERFMRDLDGPYFVKATQITFSVPFRGEADVFRCRRGWSSAPQPRATINHDTISIHVVRRDHDAAAYRKAFDDRIASIESELRQFQADVSGLEQTLQVTARTQVARRREKRRKDQGLLDGLGLGKPRAGRE